MKACMLPDYASRESNGRTLERVGVHGVRVTMKGLEGSNVSTLQSLYVELLGQNGVHMSRLIDIIKDNTGYCIGTYAEILKHAIESHDANKAFYEVAWTEDAAVESFQGKPERLAIPCSLEGAMIQGESPEWFLSFKFPYASVCPCSAEMTGSVGAGYPHMQRASANVTIQIQDLQYHMMYQLLQDITNAVVLIPISLMKRKDELEWCKLAEKTTLFVEDAARKIGDVIDRFSIIDWVVVCEHEESIHQHNVVAVCRKGGRLS